MMTPQASAQRMISSAVIGPQLRARDSRSNVTSFRKQGGGSQFRGGSSPVISAANSLSTLSARMLSPQGGESADGTGVLKLSPACMWATPKQVLIVASETASVPVACASRGLSGAMPLRALIFGSTPRSRSYPLRTGALGAAAIQLRCTISSHIEVATILYANGDGFRPKVNG